MRKFVLFLCISCSSFKQKTPYELRIRDWSSAVCSSDLLQHFWSGSIFLIAVPVLIPLLVLAPRLVPESRDPEPGPIDPAGIALVTGALGALVYAIKELATHGPTRATMLIAALGLACGIAFVRRMLVRRNPMLDVRLFTNPVFPVALMVNLVSIFALVGFIYFLRSEEHTSEIQSLMRISYAV